MWEGARGLGGSGGTREAVTSDSHFYLLPVAPSPSHMAQETHEVAEGDRKLGPGEDPTIGLSHPSSLPWYSGALCQWEARAGAQQLRRTEFQS